MSMLRFRYFLVAAQEMNFRRAAEKLYITQQSLSVHIQKLEDQYGVVLFERKPRLKLTPAGECLRTYAQRLLHTEEQLVAELADISKTSTGKLTVGITGARGQIFMPLIWDKYHQLFPNISISLAEAMTVSLDKLLFDGKIDLYIGVNAPRRNNTECLTLAHEKAYCIVSRDLLKKRNPQNWQQLLAQLKSGVELTTLKDMPLICLPPDNRLRITIDQYFEKNNIHPQIIFETSLHDLIFKLCQEGHGVGFILQMYLYGALQHNDAEHRLYILPIKSKIAQNTIDLVYRKESFRPQFHAGFIQAALDVFTTYTETIDQIIGANTRESDEEPPMAVNP